MEFIDLNAKLQPLNLGQGFPDFMPAEKVVKELAKACDPALENPLLHQYTRGYVRLNFSDHISETELFEFI